jgi:phosphatidylserine/phosphatidylglycerophosphate/cardiolipin synthase-like enzyme
LNEILRRALFRVRLSEEDVAARLEVDPKTVRRWLEGRVPYLRHRWALANMLALDEADIWPQVRTTRSRPEEVRAIYPHRDAVPPELWQDLFRSAEREIDVLTESGLFLAEDPRILAALRDRAHAGVEVRICLPDPYQPRTGDMVERIRDALTLYGPLRASRDVEIRLHRVTPNNSIYRADDELLVGQHAFGISAQRVPVLHLRRTDTGDLVATYLKSFDRIWADASTFGVP